jgi:hypothetical protein
MVSQGPLEAITPDPRSDISGSLPICRAGLGGAQAAGGPLVARALVELREGLGGQKRAAVASSRTAVRFSPWTRHFPAGAPAPTVGLRGEGSIPVPSSRKGSCRRSPRGSEWRVCRRTIQSASAASCGRGGIASRHRQRVVFLADNSDRWHW